MLRLALASLAAVLVSALSSCASPPAPADVRIANVEGRQLSYRVLGRGQPVLVMISGLGEGMSTFADVAPRLAQHATIIVYDRAGYGGSAPAPEMRDAAAMDRELSELLHQSGVRGPYVVLGHSVGGLYAEYFAAHHADEVAGLILEDSRPADFTRRCEAAHIQMCAAPAAIAMRGPKGEQQEFQALAATAQQVEASPQSDAPTLVLSRAISTRPSAWDALWAQNQNDLAARYRNGRHLNAPNGGHYIHVDAAAWFVSTVTDFLRRPQA